GIRFGGCTVHIVLRIGKESGFWTFGVDELGEVLRDLLCRGRNEPAVVGVRRGGQRPVVHGLEARLAAIAGTHAVTVSAVVGCRLAGSIEEEPVNLVPFECLP